jgi:hypothetical protein
LGAISRTRMRVDHVMVRPIGDDAGAGSGGSVGVLVRRARRCGFLATHRRGKRQRCRECDGRDPYLRKRSSREFHVPGLGFLSRILLPASGVLSLVAYRKRKNIGNSHRQSDFSARPRAVDFPAHRLCDLAEFLRNHFALDRLPNR